MTRIEAFCRLQKTLLARREDLYKILTGELAYLQDYKAADTSGDSADMAFEAGGDEMSSKLAELDGRELTQIEWALARWQQGRYGICDGGSWNCQNKISVARLKVLPYTPFCINCEREIETRQGGPGRQTRGNWAKITDTQAFMQDQRINLSDLEKTQSCSQRGG
jgi:RNA polymerase-binding transcription factor DksA